MIWRQTKRSEQGGEDYRRKKGRDEGKKRVKSLHRLKEALGNYLDIEGNYLDHTSKFAEVPPL